MEKLNRIFSEDENQDQGSVHFRGFKDGVWRLLPQDAPLKDVDWIDVRGRISQSSWEAIAVQLGLSMETLLDKVEIGQHSQYFSDIQCEGLIARVLRVDSGRFENESEDGGEEDQENVIHDASRLILGQLTILQNKEAILTMSDNADDIVNQVIQRYRTTDAQVDSDYLVYLLLDTVIDAYFHVVMEMETSFEGFEDMILEKRMTSRLGELHDFRKSLFSVRNAASNLHDAIENRMMDRQELNSVYMRELYEHLRSIEDYALYFREGITSLIEIMLTMNDNRLNEIMTTLTVFATIFIPLTFLTGVYGMNFDYMPELGLKFGYPVFWLISILVTLWMVRYFKRRKWL